MVSFQLYVKQLPEGLKHSFLLKLQASVQFESN